MTRLGVPARRTRRVQGPGSMWFRASMTAWPTRRTLHRNWCHAFRRTLLHVPAHEASPLFARGADELMRACQTRMISFWHGTLWLTMAISLYMGSSMVMDKQAIIVPVTRAACCRRACSVRDPSSRDPTRHSAWPSPRSRKGCCSKTSTLRLRARPRPWRWCSIFRRPRRTQRRRERAGSTLRTWETPGLCWSRGPAKITPRSR
mmetsp:Transcript_6290/g.14319  ORF Transcript_6290/g.14319 Transcript_6290/m.14319 type:complete len:204 (+) Transcript_6290:1279-1890(+)